VVVTGDGEPGFEAGEGASKTATTSKEGSRRANYPILTVRREVVTINNDMGRFSKESCNWNGHVLNSSARNDERASLVPAAAVIPALIAYIKVVAVKKLVVGFVIVPVRF